MFRIRCGDVDGMDTGKEAEGGVTWSLTHFDKRRNNTPFQSLKNDSNNTVIVVFNNNEQR